MVAIAVVAIGLTAVLGLLPGAIQSGRTAADNTLAATLAQDAFASMRRQVLALATTGPSWSLGPLGTTPSITYWDAAGVINTPPLPDRYFQVTRAWTPSSLMPNSMLILTATVTWPANAPAASQNSSIFVTEIARYNQ
jgi:type II secretory pathway pseudopilin PulG